MRGNPSHAKMQASFLHPFSYSSLRKRWTRALSVANLVYFLSSSSSLRAQTAKTLISTKSGVSADSGKSAKKCGEPHFLRIFYAESAVFRTFPHFLALFLESAETPLFVEINVFAVWALRLDRKYTTPTPSRQSLFETSDCQTMVPFVRLRFSPLLDRHVCPI